MRFGFSPSLIAISTLVILSNACMPNTSPHFSEKANDFSKKNDEKVGFALIFGEDERIALSDEALAKTVGIIETKALADADWTRVCTGFASNIDQITTVRHCIPEELLAEEGREYRITFGDISNFKIDKAQISEFALSDVLNITVPGIVDFLPLGTVEDSLEAKLVAFDSEQNGLFISQVGEVGIMGGSVGILVSGGFNLV